MNDNLNKNDYIKILNKYKNVLKNQDIKHHNNFKILNKTEEYLKEQINKLVIEEKNNFLMKELELELKRIGLLKKML